MKPSSGSRCDCRIFTAFFAHPIPTKMVQILDSAFWEWYL
jgi:hypothetical protein